MRALSWFILAIGATSLATDNINYASNIAKNLQRSHGDEQNEQQNALVYKSASSNPLAIPQEDFEQMYEDNKDLWGDMPKRDAYVNYMRSQSGNVDSARLLMEFSMVPSAKASGSELHKAAASGDSEAVAALLDVETGSALVDPVKADGTTPLITAVMHGQLDVVKVLLEQGADTEKVGINGATALHVAASMGYADIITELLDNGANVNVRHKFAGSSSLHFAVEMGQLDVIRLLCQRGIDVEAKKTNGGRALHVAADSNQSLAAEILVKECKADVNALLLGDTTPLYLAASKGFNDVVKVMLSSGADSNFQMPRDGAGSAMMVAQQESFEAPTVAKGKHAEIDEEALFKWSKQFNQAGSDQSASGFEQGNGASALHAAVENGHIDTVKILLEAGVKQLDSMEGVTPLYTAAEYDRPKIAALLLKHGGDADFVMKTTGITALFRALQSNRIEVARVLLAHGAKVDQPNRDGTTPLFFACGAGRPQAFGLLLKYGADVFRRSDDGTHCLHAAAQRGQVEVIKAVMSMRPKDVKIDDPGHDGQTMLHYAASGHNLATLELLLAKGADVEARATSTGSTPLMMAARQGSDKIVEALLASKANINATANAKLYKARPLYLAAQRGRASVIELLLKHQAYIDARLTTGATALFAAVESGRIDAVHALLKHKATVNFRDVLGQSALAIAVKRRFAAATQALLDHGAKVNIQLKDGDTLLHLALANKDHRSMALLLERGAWVDVPGRTSLTVAQMAQKERLFDTLKLLGKYADNVKPAAAEPQTNDEFADTTVIMVSKVAQNGVEYLVDKRSGLVYADNSDEAVVIGRWNAETGVVLESRKSAQEIEPVENPDQAEGKAAHRSVAAEANGKRNNDKSSARGVEKKSDGDQVKDEL
eukprot:TRINITY_DN12169_c2_g2_i5.p1 TRINITY_DN12169_c2_g2~~TRINITY_DN12169_c2_g2_i5.p1  ORF type:complete len:888 (+),score=255.09 TRINITY_DN12169_c2_g2_i5:75-2738(+)